jgi:hypothetical protein
MVKNAFTLMLVCSVAVVRGAVFEGLSPELKEYYERPDNRCASSYSNSCKKGTSFLEEIPDSYEKDELGCCFFVDGEEAEKACTYYPDKPLEGMLDQRTCSARLKAHYRETVELPAQLSAKEAKEAAEKKRAESQAKKENYVKKAKWCNGKDFAANLMCVTTKSCRCHKTENTNGNSDGLSNAIFNCDSKFHGQLVNAKGKQGKGYCVLKANKNCEFFKVTYATEPMKNHDCPKFKPFGTKFMFRGLRSNTK